MAEKRGNSTLVVASPTQHSCDNYMYLLPQLEPERSTTTKVQTKSEARYIAERSLRNAISHVISIAVSHYQIGRPDPRLKPIDKATEGAKLLHKLVHNENKGSSIRVVYPMFMSTTDDTTVFAFQGIVKGKERKFIIKVNQNST